MIAHAHADAAVDKVRREFAEVIEQSADVLTRHENGVYTYVSPACRMVYGLDPAEMVGHAPFEFIHPDDRERVMAKVAQARARGDRFQVEHRVLRPDGSAIWVQVAVRWDRGTEIGYGSIRDITARRLREAELRESTARFEAAFQHAPIGMAITNLDGCWIKVNRALCQITGYDERAMLTMGFQQLLHPDDLVRGREAFEEIVSGGRDTWESEVRYVDARGHVVWVAVSVSLVRDADARPVYVVAQLRDVTEQKRLKERLVHLADHDPLTNLFNRRRFESELERQVRRSRRYGEPAALLMLDLYHFKYVNDSLGHSVGDRVIAHVGGLLSGRLRDTDIVARLGGDEFAVILPRVDAARACELADEIVRTIARSPLVHENHPYRLSGSIGVVMLSEGAGSPEDALVSADIAVYDAKQHGRGCVAMYSPETREDVLDGLTWSERLREALACDGFELHAQPIVNLESGETEMHELLIRMRSESGGLIPPGRFLEPAARFGYMPAIDRWVIAQAVRLAAAAPGRRLAVNLAAKTVAEPGLVEYVTEQARRSGADPADLVFELSEADVVGDVSRVQRTCAGLRALGCAIALDNFGSGFSAFAHLKTLPVDLLKIDGRFIRDLATSSVDRLLVRAILDVADGLGLPTVAEFVTDAAVAEHCRVLGATYGQGFHLGLPAPVGEWHTPRRLQSSAA